MEENRDLRERTKKFAIGIVKLYSRLPQRRTEVRVLANQLLRSGTSVAANYREASRARSRPEFISKIDVCTQEADESMLWLDLLLEGCEVRTELIQPLRKEINELICIFVTMSKRSKGVNK